MNKIYQGFAGAVMALMTALLVIACGGGGGSPAPVSSGISVVHNQWTWVSGASSVGASGVYGTQGVAAASNVPPARSSAVSWIDGSNHLWFFGGWWNPNFYNDLWKFDGVNWTWVSGSNTYDATGSYGTKGVTAPTNVPCAREGSVSWTDRSGNLWLFGGNRTFSLGGGYLNDLWKFDGTNWTWVSGANTANASGVYGTLGLAAATNVPGSRIGAISWSDSAGNLWLFGGNGFDSAGTQGNLNDLWKFDGTNWTWVSGSNLVNASGVYGTQGVAAASNAPGARQNAMSWIDSAGNRWLFGGWGYDSIGTGGYLNDLWKFDGTNWTWVSGRNLANASGVYGTQGVAAASGVPGARQTSVSWIDSAGNRWLFGGWGYDSTGTGGYLNDLWKFDGTNWTWMSGSNLVNASGVYGTQGVAAASAVPGARQTAVSWIDSTGRLWMFSGQGYDAAGTQGNLNDLWSYQP